MFFDSKAVQLYFESKAVQTVLFFTFVLTLAGCFAAALYRLGVYSIGISPELMNRIRERGERYDELNRIRELRERHDELNPTVDANVSDILQRENPPSITSPSARGELTPDGSPPEEAPPQLDCIFTEESPLLGARRVNAKRAKG